jgi:hypothetical protein
MNEIICPHCKKPFKLDDSGYAEIVQQVKNHEFEAELARREQYLKKEKETAIQLTEERVKNSLSDALKEKEQELALLKSAREQELRLLKSQKDREVLQLAAQKEQELNQLKSAKENELFTLRARLEAFESDKALAVTEALSKIQ